MVSFNFNDNATVRLSKLSQKYTNSNINDFRKLMHALEIDWDGAKLPNANPANGGEFGPINDTGELLDLIDTMQKEIYVLTAAVIALAQR